MTTPAGKTSVRAFLDAELRKRNKALKAALAALPKGKCTWQKVDRCEASFREASIALSAFDEFSAAAHERVQADKSCGTPGAARDRLANALRLVRGDV